MNPSTLYATLFVEELIRSGLKAVCLAPGSRNTPLVLAFAKCKDRIQIYSHLDERSAAFFALGLALASDAPVALVCTSGSAGANFFPAIVEAHQSSIPLIVLTADRPHELRHSGANQTIDQIKLYGDYAKWFVDTALPETEPSEVSVRNVRTTANRVYATANAHAKGVVHINMPFRKPLEPSEAEAYLADDQKGVEGAFRRDEQPATTIFNNVRFASPYIDFISKYENVLIVCGPGAPSGTFPQLVHQLAAIKGCPLIADGTSGVRFVGTDSDASVWTTYNFVEAPMSSKFSAVLYFGGVPTSNELNALLNNLDCENRILISESGVWADDKHHLSHLIIAEPALLVEDIIEDILNEVDTPKISSHAAKIAQIETAIWDVVDYELEKGDYFDGAVVYDVVRLIPDESTLFVGNSLPVRHLDQFGRPNGKHIYTYANRGASGIDGNISTALGLGAARPDRPLVAIIGDVTFYHDMNGLLAVQRCGVPITIVLLNNAGGGIFNRLPISKFGTVFTDYFITPHGLDFSHAAKLYGLDYIQVQTRDAFKEAFPSKVGTNHSTIIEVQTNAVSDLARRKAITERVKRRLSEFTL